MKNSYKIQWLVWSSLSVFRRRKGKGKVSEEWSVLLSAFRSDTFPSHTHTHTHTMELQAWELLFLKVWPATHLHQNQKGLLSLKIPAFPWGGSETSVSSWPSRGLMPPKFKKPGLKFRLRAANHPHPQLSLPGTGVHWSSRGLVPASQPWGEDTGPKSFGQAGGLAWVSTGASRPACAQPSRGRPWSPWTLSCVLVGVGAAVGSAHRWRRRCCNRWSQPTLGTAASAWCRSTGCQGWRLHRVVRLG